MLYNVGVNGNYYQKGKAQGYKIMTNLNIIANEAIVQGIYTKEQITAMLQRYGGLLIMTFSEWKQRGYTVKKGEHAKIICSIWRKKTSKPNEEVNQNEEIQQDLGFYKKVSYFFTLDQVEKIRA